LSLNTLTKYFICKRKSTNETIDSFVFNSNNYKSSMKLLLFTGSPGIFYTLFLYWLFVIILTKNSTNSIEWISLHTEDLWLIFFPVMYLFQPTSGMGNKCYDTFSASSAATGVASGIFALVLGAK